MPGYRRPKIAAERVGAAIKSGAASPASLGGEVIATPVRPPAPPRRVSPKQPVTGVFSVPGPLSVTYYELGLDNTWGRPLAISRCTVRVGTPPVGGPLVVQVVLDGFALVGEVVVPEGAVFAATPAGIAWEMDHYLEVDVRQVGPSVAGADMVVQVVAT